MYGARNLELKGEEGKVKCFRKAPLPPFIFPLGKTSNSQMKLEVWGLTSFHISIGKRRTSPCPIL